jgi:uncharacterized metal-binding protein
MEANQIPIDRYVIVTELGIDKSHDFDVDDSDIEIVVEAVKRPQEGTLPVNRLGEKPLKGDERS